jgi:enoyl-CoA hydratase/carnithine racemase
MSNVVLYEKKGKIAIITYNRPEVFNVYNLEVLREAEQIWCDFRDDPDLWVAIITGAGEKAFCAGADLKGLDHNIIKGIHRIDHDLDVGKPIIAAINGFAVSGGMTLMLACDLAIAAEHAKFGLRQPIAGLVSDLGSGILPRAIPRKLAMELLLTCKLIDAHEAYRIGLINKVVPMGELMPAAIEMAEMICQNSPLGVRAARDIARKTFEVPLSQAMEIGNEYVLKLMQTEDAKEGGAAFYEKRKPNWKAK